MKKKLSDPIIPLRRDITFCLGYFNRLPFPFSVGNCYIAFYDNMRVISDTDFSKDLEYTLYVALRAL